MLKSIWKDPVGSAVISGVLLAAGGAAGTYVLDLWPVIGRWFASVWARAGEPSLVSNGVVWLLTIFAIPTLLMIAALVWAALRPDREAAAESWRTYTEDGFLGLHWRWTYFSSGNLGDPIPFCPHCDYQVFPHHASAYSAVNRIGFHCDSCGRNLPEFNESFDDLRSKIARLIQQKIRIGKWRSENVT